MKYAWIKDHAGEFPVLAMCRVLGVARSAFNAWRSNPQRKRDVFQAELARKIDQIERDARGVYGSPRVTAELNARGTRVSENTVARCMKAHGIRAKTARRFVPRTTDSDHTHPVADNVLDRQFQASAPNCKWVCDITYIPTDQGWLYLAGVMDLFSRKIVGWSMGTRMPTELVRDALAMALQRRKAASGPAAPQRPRRTVRQRGLPVVPQGPRHRSKHEPSWRLLRQRGDGEFLGHA